MSWPAHLRQAATPVYDAGLQFCSSSYGTLHGPRLFNKVLPSLSGLLLSEP